MKIKSYTICLLLFVAGSFVFLNSHAVASTDKTVNVVAETGAVPSAVPEKMSVKEKKERFRKLLLPPIQKVYKELQGLYEVVKSNIKAGDRSGLDKLKAVYGVKTDTELLLALKPHPVSVALAQAAMESAWATSRFVREANNAFGIWSSNNSEPRIAALEKRGNRKIWLRKYNTLEDSVRDSYRLLAKSKHYRAFRQRRIQTNNPYELVKELNNYSEIGHKYGKQLASIIRYNNFLQHDQI